MWALFFESTLLLAVLIYLPGVLFMKRLQYTNTLVLSMSPVISVAIYELLGLILGILNITGWSATLLMISLPSLVPALSLLLFRFPQRNDNKRISQSPRFDFAAPIVFLFISLLVSGIVFVKSLNGPASFSQQSDNVAHLSSILEIAQDGNYSFLNTASYPLSLIHQGIAPSQSVGFYPNGFHVIASFAFLLPGVSAPLAENAALLLFSGIVFPLNFYGLFKSIFSNNRFALLAGSLAIPAFAAFPYALGVFGPLYSNLASMCCFSSIVLIFIHVTKQKEKKSLLKGILIFIISCFGVCTLQPNTLFTVAVFLVPYCCHLIFNHTKQRYPERRVLPFLFSAGFCLLVAICWISLYLSPMLQGVVSFNWSSLFDPFTGLINVLSLALRFNVSQPFLSLLIFIGIMKSLRNDNLRWISYSFIVMCILYYAGATTDSLLKNVLTGFWYTDHWRTAANIALAGVPLVALGISTLLEGVYNLVKINKPLSQVSCFLLFLLIGLVNYYPLSFLPGSESYSAFGQLASSLESTNRLDDDKIFTQGEREFTLRVKKAVPEGSLILNMPYDGSFFAALSGDLNLYYRTNRLPDESVVSKTLREGISNLDNDSDVHQALQNAGVTYIMLLDRNGYLDQGNEQWSLSGSYYKSDWEGFPENLDGISSLELVLSDKDMRLYKIVF